MDVDAILFCSLLLVFVPTCLCQFSARVAGDTSEDVVEIDFDKMKKLYSKLLDNYDTRIRPRLDQDHTVHVDSTFYLLNVIEFNTQDQKFSVIGYFTFSWYDDLLTWNSKDYSGTNTLRIPVSEIWTPNIVFLKAYNGDGTIGEQTTDKAKVSNVGYVQWVPDGMYSVVCEVDIRFFPFDVQECSFAYYVGDATVNSVELVHETMVNTSEFTHNSEWDLLETWRVPVNNSNNNLIDLRFKMKRRGGFIMFTVIAPLLMLSFLNGCVFLVPINSGEKGSFAITVFLSYGIFVTIVMDTLPHNSLQVSYFILFIVALLSISVLLVLYTIVQSRIFHSVGKLSCGITCFKRRRDIDTAGNCTYTWTVYMERLDVCLFFIFLFLVASCSVIFMTLIYYRIELS